jgi:spoIIIJ-associated protein
MDEAVVQTLEERVGRWLEALNLDLDYRVKPSEEGNVVELKGPDEGIFLEADGKLLLAFQYLINRVEDRHNGPRVILDVGDFRQKKQSALGRMAEDAAMKVEKSGQRESLGFFNPYERRLIHVTVNQFPGLTSYSLGTDYEKELFVDLKENEPVGAKDAYKSKRPRR